jgi:hypothetical protein
LGVATVEGRRAGGTGDGTNEGLDVEADECPRPCLPNSQIDVNCSFQEDFVTDPH